MTKRTTWCNSSQHGKIFLLKFLHTANTLSRRMRQVFDNVSDGEEYRPEDSTSFIGLYCDYINAYYGNLLTEEESNLIKFLQTRYQEISVQKIVNILNRKKAHFCNYDEQIPGEDLRSLKQEGILREITDIPLALSTAKKSSLLYLCEHYKVCVSLNAKKASIINKIRSQLKGEEISGSLNCCTVAVKPIFQRLSFLFFGNTKDNFAKFYSIQRGGKVPVTINNRVAFLTTRQQLEAFLELDELKGTIPSTIDNAVRWILNIRSQCYYSCKALERAVERFIEKSAGQFEKNGQLVVASTLFQLRDSYRAAEGTLRILRRQTGKKLLKSHPFLTAATGANLKNYLVDEIGSTRPRRKTLLLKSSETLRLVHPSGEGIEKDVCKHLQGSSSHVFHSENFPFQFLYHRFCLDLIIPDAPDLKPATLFSEDLPLTRLETFYSHYHFEINAALKKVLRWQQQILSELKVVAFGGFEAVIELLHHASPEQVRLLLGYISQAPHERLRGYPDLIVVQEGRLKLIEVKGPGDSIRIEQQAIYEYLDSIGLEVKFVKVEYEQPGVKKTLPKRRRFRFEQMQMVDCI